MSQKAENLLADLIEIKTPQRLYDVAESLRDFISKGLLREIPGENTVHKIVNGQPFPDDLINIEFETVPGGTKYLLSCETYKGMGGVFKKIG